MVVWCFFFFREIRIRATRSLCASQDDIAFRLFVLVFWFLLAVFFVVAWCVADGRKSMFQQDVRSSVVAVLPQSVAQCASGSTEAQSVSRFEAGAQAVSVEGGPGDVEDHESEVRTCLEEVLKKAKTEGYPQFRQCATTAWEQFRSSGCHRRKLRSVHGGVSDAEVTEVVEPTVEEVQGPDGRLQ